MSDYSPSRSHTPQQRRNMNKTIIAIGGIVAALSLSACASATEQAEDATPTAITTTATPSGPTLDEMLAEAEAERIAEDEAREAEEKAARKAEREAEREAAEAKEREAASFREVDSRELAKIIRNPDAHIGEKIIIWGEITQFDAATGIDTFRANVASWNTTSYGYFDGENALLFGTAKMLDDFVYEDVFIAKVTVNGSLDYDTQIGGSTTVPLFEVFSIEFKGSNA